MPAHNALWNYQERMGRAVGLSPSRVGALLGVSILAGAAGATLAAVTGTRLGYSRPQWLAFGVLIAAALLLARKSSVTVFVLAAILVKVGWFYGFPLLQGALARLDTTGRALILAGTLQTVGSALGPASAAYWVPRGYEYVGWTGVFYYALAVPLAIGVLNAMDRASEVRK